MSTEIAESKSFSLAPQNIEEALKFADMMSKSNLVPKEFTGNPGNILVAIQWGMELGLQPMQAMQNIAVINGRPSLWGDSVIALVRSSPLCEYINETDDGHTATCTVKRKGDPNEHVRTFSMEDAKQAGLAGKQGPWTNYPKRMRQMRARAFALRDVFPDVLRGMPIAEELMDMPERDITGQTEIVGQVNKPEPVELDEATFTALEQKYRTKIEDGSKKPEDFFAWVESKGTVMTEAQKKTVRDWVPKKAEESDDPFVAEMKAAEQENKQ